MANKLNLRGNIESGSKKIDFAGKYSLPKDPRVKYVVKLNQDQSSRVRSSLELTKQLAQ